MKFNEALLVMEGIENDILSLDMIKDHPNHSIIKEHLYCPEKDCNARLIYTARGINGFLGAIDVTEHSENCIHHESKIEERNIMKSISVNGELTNEGIDRKKRDFHKQVLNRINPTKTNDTKNTKKNKGSVKTKSTSNNTDEIILKVDPTNSQKQSEEDFLDKKYKRKEPPFFTRFLKDVTVKDNHKNIKTCGYIKSIEFGERTVKIDVVFEGVKGTFILTEDFFNGINREQMISMLKEISVISDERQLLVEAICQIQSDDLENLKLYVYDSRNLGFFIDNKYFKRISYVISYLVRETKYDNQKSK